MYLYIFVQTLCLILNFSQNNKAYIYQIILDGSGKKKNFHFSSTFNIVVSCQFHGNYTNIEHHGQFSNKTSKGRSKRLE